MVEAQITFDRGEQRRVDHPSDEHEKQRRYEEQDRGDVGADALDKGFLGSPFRVTQLHSPGYHLALYRFFGKCPDDQFHRGAQGSAAAQTRCFCYGSSGHRNQSYPFLPHQLEGQQLVAAEGRDDQEVLLRDVAEVGGIGLL